MYQYEHSRETSQIAAHLRYHASNRPAAYERALLRHALFAREPARQYRQDIAAQTTNRWTTYRALRRRHDHRREPGCHWQDGRTVRYRWSCHQDQPCASARARFPSCVARPRRTRRACTSRRGMSRSSHQRDPCRDRRCTLRSRSVALGSSFSDQPHCFEHLKSVVRTTRHA